MGSDYIAEDLNDHPTDLQRQGVYHLRNITTESNIKVPNILSDHDILICSAEMPFERKLNKGQLTIVDKAIARVE